MLNNKRAEYESISCMYSIRHTHFKILILANF